MMNWLNELLRQLLFLPPQASTVARGIDTLHYTVITVTMLGATAVFLVALVFVVRFRSGDAPPARTPRLHAPLWLETLFIVPTLGLFLIFWQIGFAQFVHLATAPEGAIEIYVSAKQWMWRFAYPDGSTSLAVAYVPAGRPVKLIMTSRDVIHSFFVPDFRVKADVVPGRYSSLWFEADKPGTHEVLCAEYCGTDHSMMRAQVVVLSPTDYARRFTASPRPSLAAEGREIAARWGCLRCHTVDGTTHIGPTWVGLYGSPRRFAGGGTAVADEAYLTASMMDPHRDVVLGFLPVMPTYQGLLAPGDVSALVEYIKSLARAADGAQVPPEVKMPPEGPAFVPREAP